MTSTLEQVEPVRERRSLPPAWDAVRGLLLGLWVGAWMATLSTGAIDDSFARLDDDLRQGKSPTVLVSTAENPGFEGYRSMSVRWSDGLVQRQTTIVWRKPGPDRTRADGTRVMAEEPGSWLARTYGVHVVRADLSHRASFEPWVGGPEVYVPPVVGELRLLALWLPVLLLIAGPEPWRATRWAWFWLIAATPLAIPVLLVLSGRTPGIPDPLPRARRLTGGWALLLAFLLPGITGSIVSDVHGWLT